MLYLKRTDKELANTNAKYDDIPSNAEQHDWPTYEKHFDEFDKIDDIFSESLKYGYGKLRLLSSTESSLDQFHRYRELIFVSSEAQAGC